MQEYKFRGKRIDNNQWVYGSLITWPTGEMEIVNCDSDTTGDKISVIPETVGIWSGHKINETDLYAGDIVRNEIMNDEGDIMKYMVCMFIKEWTMFAMLWVYEYQNYLNGGAEALDESMFWTFPIEDKDNVQRRICGNIWDNPELLNAANATVSTINMNIDPKEPQAEREQPAEQASEATETQETLPDAEEGQAEG